MSERIVKTPGTCGGKPRIAGRRIRVQDIAIYHERLGYTPDEIALELEGLSLSDVHTALAYYYDHQAEIESDIAADEAFVEELRRRTPSKLMTEKVREGGSAASG